MRVVIICFLGLVACHSQPEQSIQVKNELDLERLDELITISRNKILKLAKENFPVIRSHNGEEIPSQLEDLDNDGEWDQVLFLVDFSPLEEKEINVSFSAQAPQYPKATDVYFGVGTSNKNVAEVQRYQRLGDPRGDKKKSFFQMEGPSWENDKVGFRIYFDPRNGIDIFGKTSPELTLSKVGLGELADYHSKKGWGMDILKVGNSLGAGSIALEYKGAKMRITGEKGTTFMSINEGPIKASFLLTYQSVGFEGSVVEIEQKIGIVRGQWYYKSEVALSKQLNRVNLLAGIANIKPNQLETSKYGDYSVLSSYGIQSENNDKLGMALLIPTDDYVGSGEVSEKARDINSTYFSTIRLQKMKPSTYYFFSGWEASDRGFKTEEGFKKELKNTALRLSSPIVIK